MKKIYALIFAFAFALLISACGSQSVEKSDLSVSCASLQPTENDVKYGLEFGKELFTEVNWQRSYTVKELQSTISWTHRTMSALADVTVYMFCDEVGTDDVTWFYSEDALKIMFEGYDEATLVSSCGKDRLLLYEVDAVEEGQQYKIRLWAEPLNKSRLLSVLLTFPIEESDLLLKYGEEFFPDLPVCP